MIKTGKTTGRKVARFCIWSIRHHDFLVSRLRIYMFSGVAVILLLTLGSRIDLQTALHSLMLAALAVLAVLYGFIYLRKNRLLNIRDPELKLEAHRAMIEFILIREANAGKKDGTNRLLQKIRIKRGA